MSEHDAAPTGPDLTQGVPASALADGAMLRGHAQGEAVLLARRGDAFFAVGATCTHYGGPLDEGLMVDDTVRCPWHHACFSLRSGEALRAPALNAIACWKVEQRDGKVWVLHPEPVSSQRPRGAADDAPSAIAIIGGGAAGNAAAEVLRREGYAGRITMLSADDAGPYDRPNLSKNYLAGTAPEDWIPLRSADFYREHDIDLRLSAPVMAIDTQARQVLMADGGRCPYDRLLLATGAEPARLDLPGAELPHVHLLRSLADSRALVAQAQKARRAAVIGTGFIGLEVAASLRARGLEVEVVGADPVPMAKVMGPEIGALVRRVHEAKGVRFHLGTTPSGMDRNRVMLKNGERIEADLVVVGIGVRPAVGLAQQAGLAIDRGVVVDEFLQTSAPGVFAAGDIARWPDPRTGERIRVEHWVVAERQGQTAARNMLGRREPFDAVPFFWTEQHDLTIAYVGHAERWDTTRVEGDLDARDAQVSFLREGRVLAVATVGRDLESLRAERAFELGPA
ncbi:MAG TPA: FAD-dependent oxidoreductase [Albitalea sp.]|uniref:FAD-dependent oxidoreductase n=1 Tax=Piscinibacter sp. TaxID=1903157 RepID=UPI002ED05FB6